MNQHYKSKQTKRNGYIELLRIIAAFMVLVYHFVSYNVGYDYGTFIQTGGGAADI